MKESPTLVRHLITKLNQVGWTVDLYIEPKEKWWECYIWKKQNPDIFGKAAGTTRLSALWAAIIEVIRNL